MTPVPRRCQELPAEPRAALCTALEASHKAAVSAPCPLPRGRVALPRVSPAGCCRTQAVEHQAPVVVGHLEAGLALDGGRVVLHGGGELHPQVLDVPAVVEGGGEVSAGAAEGERERRGGEAVKRGVCCVCPPHETHPRYPWGAARAQQAM